MEVCCAHSRSWLNPYWLNVGIKSVLQVWYMLSTNSTLIKFYNFTCKKCSSANKAQLDLISPSCLQDWESYQKVIFSDMQVVVRLKVLGRMASSSAFFLVSVCLNPASSSHSTNPFIVHSFTWVLMYFPEGLLFWLIPSSIPTARSLKRKGKEEKKIPWTSHCWFFWSSSLFANVRFWNHGPLNSQHTSLFKQPLGSFPNPKLLLNINCPGGFVATLFHIH